MQIHDTAERGFHSAAETYESARPGYPTEVVERLVRELNLRPDSHLLDLGAGTGKLTRQLLQCAVSTLSIEPVEGMRKAFRRALPAAPLVAATAEHLPLKKHCLDAVVIAQAFHWFRHEQALAELSRVLKPASRFAVIWNVRDERYDWVAQLTEIIRPYEGAGDVRIPRHRDGIWRRSLAETTLFRQIAEWEVDHRQHINAEALVGRVLSTSFIAALPDAKRNLVVNRVLELADTHPDLAGRQSFEFPYVTQVSIYESQ